MSTEIIVVLILGGSFVAMVTVFFILERLGLL